MRVISGKAKGKKLKFPKLSGNKRLRPLTGRAKEALFNIIVAKVLDSRFLDLFSGTGSVGIEALSRGASLAIFVEQDRQIARTITENLEITGFIDRAEVFCLEVIKAIKVLSSKNAEFDIIFIGAPYNDHKVLEQTLNGIALTGLAGRDCVVVAEHSKRNEVSDSYGKLIKTREARYGDTVLSFYGVK